MLYKFSHLLLYTVVLVGSYAIEAPTRNSLNSSSAPSAANNCTNNIKAQLCTRRHVSKIAHKQLIDASNDKAGSAGIYLHTSSISAAYAQNHSTVEIAKQWQRCKRYTELLI